jgi:hypothetical protein
MYLQVIDFPLGKPVLRILKAERAECLIILWCHVPIRRCGYLLGASFIPDSVTCWCRVHAALQESTQGPRHPLSELKILRCEGKHGPFAPGNCLCLSPTHKNLLQFVEIIWNNAQLPSPLKSLKQFLQSVWTGSTPRSVRALHDSLPLRSPKIVTATLSHHHAPAYPSTCA